MKTLSSKMMMDKNYVNIICYKNRIYRRLGLKCNLYMTLMRELIAFEEVYLGITILFYTVSIKFSGEEPLISL